MEVRITDDLDLGKIAESGQCFRWKRVNQNTFRIIAADKCVYASQASDDLFHFVCDEESFNTFWYQYFDLAESYQRIRERISPEADPFLWNAMEQEKGIRILRQDPWEMLITSIVTQNRNIPAIQRSIELMSEMCGDKHYDSCGAEYYSFPQPERLAALSEDQLNACRLGYRSKYIHAAAAAIADGKFDLQILTHTDCEGTISRLCELYGVGTKVASCVALFGLHQLDSFPRDVWINRVLENEYPNGYPFTAYSPYNGVYQQYMFAFYRNHSRLNLPGYVQLAVPGSCSSR